MLQHLLFLRPSIEGVSVTTENLVFKLVYAISCPLFLAFGVIFYTRICFTDAINCVANSTDSFKVLKAIDSYCLENSYVLPSSQYHISPGDDHSSTVIDIEDNRLYLSNYQYAGIFFVLCGALCYLPYVLWEWFENGLLKSLLENLMPITVVDFSELKKRVDTLATIWKKNKAMLNTYAAANILCEGANMVCLVGVFLLANDFLDGGFVSLGVTTTTTPTTSAPGVFPKSALCSWDTVGVSGPVHYEGVCVMNMHFLSEKMFYAAWWWLVMCITLSVANLTYRYCLVRSVELRGWVITEGHLHSIGNLLPVQEEGGNTIYTLKDASFLQRLNYGEFFLLKRIQANVPPNTFNAILYHFYLDGLFSKDQKEE